MKVRNPLFRMSAAERARAQDRAKIVACLRKRLKVRNIELAIGVGGAAGLVGCIPLGLFCLKYAANLGESVFVFVVFLPLMLILLLLVNYQLHRRFPVESRRVRRKRLQLARFDRLPAPKSKSTPLPALTLKRGGKGTRRSA